MNARLPAVWLLERRAMLGDDASAIRLLMQAVHWKTKAVV